eukprot:974093-Rhodomonas_salina.1
MVLPAHAVLSWRMVLPAHAVLSWRMGLPGAGTRMPSRAASPGDPYCPSACCYWPTRLRRAVRYCPSVCCYPLTQYWPTAERSRRARVEADDQHVCPYQPSVCCYAMSGTDLRNAPTTGLA